MTLLVEQLTESVLAARERIEPGGRWGGIVDDRTIDGLEFLGHRIRVDLEDLARRLDPPGGFAA